MSRAEVVQNISTRTPLIVDRWDVRFRDEPDEEEEENDKKGEGDREDGDEDDDQIGGYSV